MAEFGEVMKQWKRLCETRLRQYGDESETCDECPLTKAGITCGGIFETPTDTDWNKCENAIMTWAEENPEPEYPTWFAVLYKLGIISEYLGDKTLGEHIVDELIEKRISADIAEKLGVKPI